MKKGLLGKLKAFNGKKREDVSDDALEMLEEEHKEDGTADAEAQVENSDEAEEETEVSESAKAETEPSENASDNGEKKQITTEEELDEEIYRRIALKHVERQRKKHRKKHYFLRFVVLLCIGTGVFLFLKSNPNETVSPGTNTNSIPSCERYTAVYVHFPKAVNSLKQINSKLYIFPILFNNSILSLVDNRSYWGLYNFLMGIGFINLILLIFI